MLAGLAELSVPTLKPNHKPMAWIKKTCGM
jgi:hypothetical protein